MDELTCNWLQAVWTSILVCLILCITKITQFYFLLTLSAECRINIYYCAVLCHDCAACSIVFWAKRIFIIITTHTFIHTTHTKHFIRIFAYTLPQSALFSHTETDTWISWMPKSYMFVKCVYIFARGQTHGERNEKNTKKKKTTSKTDAVFLSCFAYETRHKTQACVSLCATY